MQGTNLYESIKGFTNEVNFKILSEIFKGNVSKHIFFV